MNNDFKIGINLGWHQEGVSNEEILSQYLNWLNICYENNIRIIRIFIIRWSINALFDESKINLLHKIIHEANELNIEVVIVLNHFTDFTQQYHKVLSEGTYTWKTYPLSQRRSVKKFFSEIEESFINNIRKVLDTIIDCKNIKKIELFNEIDQVNIKRSNLVKWINQLLERLSLYTQRYDFFISFADYNNFVFFKDKVFLPIDVHLYNFPFEYAFKNIEYIKNKTGGTEVFLGEYAKFSDCSHLENCESKSYFCSGLWGAYFLGFHNSPLHWWWQELIESQDYLRIINIFIKNKPHDFFKFNNFKVDNVILGDFNCSSNGSLRKNKFFFRLRNLLCRPKYIKSEWRAILKFVKKILFNTLNRENILVRGYYGKENLWFYCEPKNCHSVKFELNIFEPGGVIISNIEALNLVTGDKKQLELKNLTNGNYQINCNFTVNHLIIITKQ